MNLRRAFKFGFIAFSILGSFATCSFADHIDFIRDDSTGGGMNATFLLTATGTGTFTDTQMGNNADILGGIRQVTFTRGGFGQTAVARKDAGTDFIRVTNDNVAAGVLTLNYSGIQNADFTAWDGFIIDIPVLQQDSGIGDGEIDISIEVRSSAGIGSIGPFRFEDPGVFEFDFSDSGFANVDFSDVDGVTFTFSSAIIGTDFQIGSITRRAVAVPEPTAIGAMAGLLGIVFFRRRRGR